MRTRRLHRATAEGVWGTHLMALINEGWRIVAENPAQGLFARHPRSRFGRFRKKEYLVVDYVK